MNLFTHYFDIFTEKKNRCAFLADGKPFSYLEFHSAVAGSRELLEQIPGFNRSQPVAVVCHNTIHTYAALFGAWFSGCPIVPLHPSHPAEWNRDIILKTGCGAVFNANPMIRFPETPEALPILNNRGVVSGRFRKPRAMKKQDPVYILTTSGTTGSPKHVVISCANLLAFIEGFLQRYPDLDETDRFFQTYDLTADAAMTGYLIPLCLGAAVLTPPDLPFRYLAVAKILKEELVTWVQVTPSLLACLRPYFGTFRLERLKHFHFGGEGLPEDLLEAWRPSIPAAEISNVYGPTETTITALHYRLEPGQAPRSCRGIVSIGWPMPSADLLIAGPEGLLQNGEGEGELLIGGRQVMLGYLGESTPYAFRKTGRKSYYCTGDLVRRDHEGYYYFLNRLNDQVKINGYRVDLTEVSQKTADISQLKRCVAVAAESAPGKQSLWVFIEGYQGSGEEIRKQMFQAFPSYLVPDKIFGVEVFPLDLAGKTDKKQLISRYAGPSAPLYNFSGREQTGL